MGFEKYKFPPHSLWFIHFIFHLLKTEQLKLMEQLSLSNFYYLKISLITQLYKTLPKTQ